MEYSRQHKTLERIRDGQIIELYSADYLKELLKTFTTDYAADRYEQVVKFIIWKNKFSKAPTSREVLGKTYNLEIPNSSKRSKTFTFNKTALWKLFKEGIILNPSILEYAHVFGTITNHIEIDVGPVNVVQKLRITKIGTKGKNLPLRDKIRPESIRQPYYERYLLALFYDWEGPVFKNCFPGVKIKFKEKPFPK